MSNQALEGQLSSQQLRTTYERFAKTVRAIDPSRIIEPGTCLPRPAAWHMAHNEPGRDNAEQSFSFLLSLTPDPMNVISMHAYEKAKEHYSETRSIDGVIRLAMAQARTAGKPLFVGEFPVRDQAQAQEFLSAIEVNRVPLSAFWIFDDPHEPAMNVDFDNERSFVFALVAQANRVLQGRE